jgi:hypothetical protein
MASGSQQPESPFPPLSMPFPSQKSEDDTAPRHPDDVQNSRHIKGLTLFHPKSPKQQSGAGPSPPQKSETEPDDIRIMIPKVRGQASQMATNRRAGPFETHCPMPFGRVKKRRRNKSLRLCLGPSRHARAASFTKVRAWRLSSDTRIPKVRRWRTGQGRRPPRHPAVRPQIFGLLG